MNRARTRRYVAALTAAVPLLTVLGIASAPAAQAAQGNFVICSGTSTVTYNPGITLTPRPVHASGVDLYAPCTSSDPTLMSGANSFDGTLTLSCLEPLASGPGTTVVNWNNGRHSTLFVNGAVTTIGGQIIDVFTGTVIEGEFEDATVTAQITEAQPNVIQCATTGVTSASGSATLQIITP